jgi:hypothetical protein
MLTAITVALIVALILLVVLIDILRVSLSVNTLLAVQFMANAKEGVRTMHGPIEPRPGTGFLGRVMHHIDGKLHERMIRRAYFHGAPAAAEMRKGAAALRTHLDSEGP